MIMDILDDLIYDLKIELGKDSASKIDKFLDEVIEEPFEYWNDYSDYFYVTISIEKINVLQENVCVNISFEGNEVELMFENGIENGTQLNEYSINSDNSLTDGIREYEEVIDVVLDEEMVLLHNPKASIKFANLMLEREKKGILKDIKNQNYDNYVTGGGTNKTDSFYKKKRYCLNNMGLYWKVVTKTHKIKANFC
jgi:hypothetical protein